MGLRAWQLRRQNSQCGRDGGACQNIAGACRRVETAFDKGSTGSTVAVARCPAWDRQPPAVGELRRGASGSAFAQAAGFGRSSSAAGAGLCEPRARQRRPNLAWGEERDQEKAVAFRLQGGLIRSLPGKVASAIRGSGANNSVQFGRQQPDGDGAE